MLRDSRLFALALLGMAGLGVALLWLFPGSAEQDAAYHFLETRLAATEPVHFVKVWARPIYAVAFVGPVQFGLEAARGFALLIGLLIAWQSWRLARDLNLPRAWLVVPLLLGQPNFLQLYPDLLTEPVFALLFVLAVRLHLGGWRKSAMLLVSLLPLARPEGFFIGFLWGCGLLVEAGRNSPGAMLSAMVRAIPSTLLLATGSVLWWAASWAITGDALFILHDWPPQWHQGTYGFGSLFSYAARAWEFAGLLLLLPLACGLALKTPERRWWPLTGSVVLLFLLHSVFHAYSLFGSAGYPRYMVSVSPALAVLTLAGWNFLATPLTRWLGRGAAWAGAGVLVCSLALSLLYSDSLIWSRDVVAIREMQGWLREHPCAVKRFIWSNGYMSVMAGKGFPDGHSLDADRLKNVKTLRESPSGTLVFWDDKLGPEWFGLTAREIEAEGYTVLRTQRYALRGVFTHGSFGGYPLTREVELSLLYKP